MTSGPVIVQVLQGDNAVESYRRIMEANPDNAENGTIRKEYALNIQENSFMVQTQKKMLKLK